MKYDLINIENGKRANAGGLCSFKFAPKEWIANDVKLNIVGNTTSAPVTLIVGKQWIEAKCLPDSVGFTEAQENTPAGQKFIQNLVGTVNGDILSTNGLMNALAYYEYVVIYSGRNNERKVIGNKKKGMNFISVLSTGTQFSEKHSYAIQLIHESAERAPYYTF